jgi:hypothetical protein
MGPLLRRHVALTGGVRRTKTPGAFGFIDMRRDISDAGNVAATALFVFASAVGRLLQPGFRATENALRNRKARNRAQAASPRTWPQLTVGGELGPARTTPTRYAWERPDAERQPNLSALRSSLGNIATVSRGASPRWEALHHRHNLTPPAAHSELEPD